MNEKNFKKIVTITKFFIQSMRKDNELRKCSDSKKGIDENVFSVGRDLD